MNERYTTCQDFPASIPTKLKCFRIATSKNDGRNSTGASVWSKDISFNESSDACSEKTRFVTRPLDSSADRFYGSRDIFEESRRLLP
jgi:hypothetical protein